MLKKADELIINVRGKNKYVVMDIERYNAFRRSKLELAHMQAMQDINNGDYKVQTDTEYIKELKDA